MCENKEIIDPNIYKKIVELKKTLVKSTSTLLFFHTRFKGVKHLESEMQDVIRLVNTRLGDLKLYVQRFSE